MTQKVIPMETKLAAIFALEGSGLIPNVAQICRELQISRQTYYKYRRRFEFEGIDGLVPRSRRPATSPTSTDRGMVAEVVAARAQLGKGGWDIGAISIRYRLLFNGVEPPAARTIHRILVREGLVVPAPQKRPRSSLRRFTFPATDDCWQIDAFHHALEDGTGVVIFQLIDDHSRYEVATLAWASEETAGAWECAARAIRIYGKPRMLLSDNGLAFSGSRMGFTVLFENNLRALGVKPITSRPYHPQTNGKNERAHQTLQRWLAARPPAIDLSGLQRLLDEYRVAYNNTRPHQALDGATPREHRLAGIRHRPIQTPLEPPTFVTETRTDQRGTIMAAASRIPLGVEFAHLPVTVFTTGLHVLVFHNEHLLRELTLNPALKYQPLERPDGRTRVKKGNLSAMS
jgi:transposase InsO family protein